MATSRNCKRSAMRNTTAESKLEAIKRVNDGESKASVARDIGVPESTLRGWCKNSLRIRSQSRQSSPDTDESLEPREKKPKTFSSPTLVQQPFNLSLKTPSAASYYASQCSKALVTPPVEYNKNEPDCSPKTPQNLSIKTETPNLTAAYNTERERKNKAELARLSAEFGLNRPEIGAIGASFLDMGTSMHGVNNWNGLVTSSSQQILQNTPVAKKKSNTVFSPIVKNPKTQLDAPAMDEYLNAWLKTQAIVMQLTAQASSACDVSTTSFNGANISSDVVSPPNIARNGTNKCYNELSSPQSSAQIPANNSDFNGKPLSSILSWYQNQLVSAYRTQTSESKPILFQQLTRETNEVENLSVHNSTSTTTSKSVLDSLLLANNNNNIINDHNISHDISPEEAVEHGDKFMKWLESFTSPSVTAMQIMQFRTLLTNVRNSINPKNDEVKNKTKVRRK